MTDTATPIGTLSTDAAPASIWIGTAPDSWGVWLPDDPKQVPRQRFLDEAATTGYEWIEAVAQIKPDVFGVVEQDMYGCSVDAPGPIAKCTFQYIFGSTSAVRAS